jgi:hypothetical protein
MKSNFDLLKNGNVSKTVWANVTTKEVYSANRNSFGYNFIPDSDFRNKYGKDDKLNQGKSNYSQFTFSAKQMESFGFTLVMRGTLPLWN